MAEELTITQLKCKGAELKKVAEARAKGKWAVYRGDRALIQEFRTPKPATTTITDPPLEPTPTSPSTPLS